MKKIRLDLLLIQRGFVPSRQKAQGLIISGQVKVDGQIVLKSGALISPDSTLTIRPSFPYVSRAGAKLARALQTFPVKVSGVVALDIGSSTGGFTDCLLQAGARKVYAVDVNIKQLDWKLTRDPRVVTIEKNARYLDPSDLPENPELVVMDVSFISILKILPAVRNIIKEGDLIVLIKPQFEASRNQVGKKGIIKDRETHRQILEQVLEGAAAFGFKLKGLTPSPILGQKGNQEFLAWLKPATENLRQNDLKKIVQEMLANGQEEKN
ncbi:MAG: TlyA family RNA methyltransferase [Acidobacteriota bacterium]|nr:TlyA family RNA methyltransferase [Acidobacteriota bacterium]